MITKIELENFKCFDKLSVSLSNLNVFTGVNNMGKSSTIQSLLLLKQSYELDKYIKGLYLNGDYVSLGSGRDLLNRYGTDDHILIKVTDEEKENLFKIKYSSKSDYLENENYSNFNENMSLFNKNLTYVSAERIGPKRFYDYSYQKINLNEDLGSKGDYWVGFLSEKGLHYKVNDVVASKTKISNLLIYQTEYWLSQISPGIKIYTEKNDISGIVNLEYGEEQFLPVNIGFGISYVAPIIVSLLKAQKDDIVIIENPEAHLHPRGQRILGELICLVASTGVQVFVETHSDHVINGIRISVKNKVISKDSIVINYYYLKKIKSNNFPRNVHCKCTPVILEDGKLSDWPDGFFDEWDKALGELI